MTDQQPTETTNLDRYGGEVIPWSRAKDLLESGVWQDGDLYFTSGPGTRKSRHLATNRSCTIAVKLPGMDLTLEGEANIVAEAAVLENVAAIYRNIGWPAEVAGDALTAPFSAPSAGPPPWHVYRFTFSSVVGVSTTEPNGATRWRFVV